MNTWMIILLVVAGAFFIYQMTSFYLRRGGDKKVSALSSKTESTPNPTKTSMKTGVLGKVIMLAVIGGMIWWAVDEWGKPKSKPTNAVLWDQMRIQVDSPRRTPVEKSRKYDTPSTAILTLETGEFRIWVVSWHYESGEWQMIGDPEPYIGQKLGGNPYRTYSFYLDPKDKAGYVKGVKARVLMNQHWTPTGNIKTASQ